MEWLSQPVVGSRELKTRLGTYLKLVKEGATVIVTDRGHPVAELRPISPDQVGLEYKISALEAVGLLSVGDEVRERRPLEDFEPIRARGESLSQTILDDREDRF